MINTIQALDLKGLYYEMHGIAKQIRIMNENNALLIQHLTTNTTTSCHTCPRSSSISPSSLIRRPLILKSPKALVGPEIAKPVH